VNTIWPSRTENSRLGREYLERYADILHQSGDRDWVGQYLRRQAWRCEADAARAAWLLGGDDLASGRRILSTGGTPFVFEFLLRKRFSGELVSLVQDSERLIEVASDLDLQLAPVSLRTADADAIARLGRFDLIALRQSFGLLRLDLAATLDHLRGLLLPGGALHLSAANGARVRRLLTPRGSGNHTTSGAAERYQASRRGAELPELRYTEKALCTLLEDAGFLVDDVSYRNRLPHRGGSRLLRQSLTLLSGSLRDEMVVTARRPEGD
jgi:hypothetical protein